MGVHEIGCRGRVAELEGEDKAKMVRHRGSCVHRKFWVYERWDGGVVRACKMERLGSGRSGRGRVGPDRCLGQGVAAADEEEI